MKALVRPESIHTVYFLKRLHWTKHCQDNIYSDTMNEKEKLEAEEC